MAGRLGLGPRFQPPDDDEDFDSFFRKTLEAQKDEYVSPQERKDYFDQIGLGQLDGDQDLKLELYEAPRSRIEQVLKERQSNNNQNLAKPPEPSLFSSPIIDLDLAKKGFASTSLGKFFQSEPTPQDDPLALTPLGQSPAPQAYTPTSPGAPPDLSKELNDMRQVFKETAKPAQPQVKSRMIGTPPEEKAQDHSFLDKALSYLPFGGFLQSDEPSPPPKPGPSLSLSPASYASPLGAFTETIMDDDKRNAFIDDLKQAGASVMQGLAQVPSGLFKSIGIAAKAIDDQLPTWLQQHGEQKTEELATYKLGQSIQESAQQAFPTDTNRQKEFLATVLPQAIGSMLGFMATGGASAALGGSRMAGTVLFGAGVQAPQGYEEAKAAGPQPDTETPYSIADVLSPLGAAAKHLGESSADPERNARKAFLLGLGIGATEAIPIERAIQRIDEASGGGLSKVIRSHGEAAAEEWIQEFFQQTAGNAVAQQLYDQNRNLLEGSFDNAAAGGVSGFMMSVIQGMLRLKGSSLGYEAANTPMTPEGVPSLDPTNPALPSGNVASEVAPSPLPEDLTIPDVVQLPSATEAIGEGLPPVDLPVTKNNLGAFEGQQPTAEVQGPPQAEALQEEGPITEEQILQALGASFPKETAPKLMKRSVTEEVPNEIPVPEPPTLETAKPLGKRAQAQADAEQKSQLASMYDAFRYADAMDDQETMQQVADQLAAQGRELPDPEQFQQWADIRDTLNAAKNSLGVAGKERGFKALTEVAGQGGTPEIASSKSPTDEWFKDLTTNPAPSKYLAEGQKSWNKEKIERTIAEGMNLLPGEEPSANLQVLLEAIQQDPKYSQLLVAEKDAPWQGKLFNDDLSQVNLFDGETDAAPEVAPSIAPKQEAAQVEPSWTPESGGVLYHGTGADIGSFKNDQLVYLTTKDSEAKGYADRRHLGGTAGESKVLSVNAAKGKAHDINDLIDEAINEGDDIEVALDAGFERARKQGARYATYEHPPFEGDEQQQVIVSLYPGDDLSVTPSKVPSPPKASPPSQKEPNKPTPYSFQPEPQDQFALTPLAQPTQKAKAKDVQPELFGTGETLEAGVSPIIGREVAPEEAPLFSKTAQEAQPEQMKLMEKDAPWEGKDSVTNAPAFKRWFKRSKVVNEDGSPKRVYHGTNAKFDEFKKGENRMSMRAEAGFWFATEPADAGRYGSETVEAFLSINNPKTITERQLDFEAQTRPMKETIAKWKRQGFDGLRIPAIQENRALEQEAQPEQWVAFDPTQIKSPSNQGTFDPKNPSILKEYDAPYQTREEGTNEPGIPEPEGRDRGVQREASGTNQDDLSRGAERPEPVRGRPDSGRPEPRRPLSPLREGGGVTTLGKRLTQDLKRVGKLDLRGADIRNVWELAELAQIYRSPQYETLRVWYVKDGKVVGHEGLTSRLPNVVSFAKDASTIQDYLDRIAKLKARFKADGFYLQHNHPSGDPTPSQEDVEMTALVQQKVPGFKGHVVINHTKFAVIDMMEGQNLTPLPGQAEMGVETYELPNVNFRENPHKAHPFLGANVTNYLMMAEMGKRIQSPKGYTTVIYRGAKGRVEAIQEVPDNMVRSSDFAGYIRNSTRDFGAVSAFTYSTSPDADLELRTMELVERGVLKDAITDGKEGVKLATEWVRQPSEKKNLSQGLSVKEAFDRTQKVMEPDAPFEGKDEKPSAAAFADLEKQDKQIARTEVRAGSQPPAGQPPRGIPPTPAFNGFDVPSESTWERIRRYVQDRFRRLAVIQEAMTEQLGPIAEEQDTYLHTELFPGKVEPQIVELEREHFRPLIQAMRDADISKEQLDQFLYAKHAPERNAHIATINDKMPDGGSGMPTAEAQRILADFATRGLTPQLDALAERVYAINQKRLDTLVNGGLITAGERQVLNDTYDFYVPLKGAPGEQAPSRPRIGKGFDIRGKEHKRALGRKSQAHSILEHVWAQSDEAIIRAEKNLVGQAFLEMAKQYPHKEMWTVNPVKFRRYFDQRTGEVKAGKDPLMKLADNVMSVKVNGKEHYIEIHDEALAQAMKNLGAERSGMILKALQGVNRYLAMVNTALNPEFVLSNFQRDIQTAGVNLAGEQGLKYVTKVMRGVPGAVRGSYAYIANQDTSTEWGKWFQEYEEAGGRIGFFGLEDIEVKRNRLNKLIERLDHSPKAKVMGLASGMHDLIFDLNGAVENGVRLSAYKHARTELGMSKKKAASLARNLTVDFNKKGILGNVMNGMYLFFNANLQGTARLARALTNKRVQKIVGGAVAGAFLHAELNRAMAGIDPDDDENWFSKLDDYIQESFIPFFYGDPDGHFVKWQLPYGYNTFYWFGQALNRLAHGEITPGQFLGGFTRTLLGAFNPIGSDDMLLKNAVPTFARWWVDLELNKNFFGGPIMPEQFPFAAPKPDSERYFRSVSASSKMLAQNINRLTGGSQWRPGWADVSPETIDYMVQYVTGGTGATILRSGSLPVKLIKGLPIESNEVPVVRKFLGNPSSWKSSARWREEADDVETALRQKKDIKTTDPAAALDFEVAEAPLLRLERHMKVAEKALNYLSDMQDVAVTMEDEAEIESLRDASERVQKWFHQAYRQAKDGEIVPTLPYDRKHNNYKTQGKRLAQRMMVMSASPPTGNSPQQQPPRRAIQQQSQRQLKQVGAQQRDPFLDVIGISD